MNPLPNDTHLCPPLSNTLPRVAPPLTTVCITRFLAFFVLRLSVILAFAILQVPPVLGQNRIAEELLKTAKTGSVFIKHSQGTGTGFFVGKDGVIATNFHVVSPIAFEKDGIPKFSTLTNLSVVVNSGESDEQTYSARILNFDMNHDLALLKIDARAAPLPLGDATNLHETSDLWAFGFPLV